MGLIGYDYDPAIPERIYLMSPLTNRLAYLLDTVTYKPGWELQAMDGPDLGYPQTILAISFKAADPVTGRPGTFAGHFPIHQSLLFTGDDRAMLRFIEHCIIELEIHEVHEFLRADGVPVTDPHPKKGT
jgi:hypothetical protein